jgi:hypothetical protein
MSKRTLSTGCLELESEGDLVEGEAPLGRVAFRLVATWDPDARGGGVRRVRCTATAAPGSLVDFPRIWQHGRDLTLTFAGGTWRCSLTHYDPGTASAELAGRGPLELEGDRRPPVK